MTTNTKTTDSASKFQVGDKIRFTDSAFPDWCGQEGVVETVGGDLLVKYRVTKAAPTDLGSRWNTIGRIAENFEKQFTLIEAADDPVSHPSHYTQYPVEVIELTRHMPFDDGNVVKYVARSPFKGNRLQDLKKARWYLDDAIAEEEKKLSGLG